MERILNAVETIESGVARKFGLENEKTKIAFSLTEFLRVILAEEDEKDVVFPRHCCTEIPKVEQKVLCFDDLVAMNEEEANKIIDNLSEEQTEAFTREGLCKLLEKMFE